VIFLVSENVKKAIEEIQTQIKNDSKYIELVTTVEYLIELVDPNKKEVFNKALEDAENMEDVMEILKALKLQLGAQGARKLLKL
jgi:hypothetical protein